MKILHLSNPAIGTEVYAKGNLQLADINGGGMETVSDGDNIGTIIVILPDGSFNVSQLDNEDGYTVNVQPNEVTLVQPSENSTGGGKAGNNDTGLSTEEASMPFFGLSNITNGAVSPVALGIAAAALLLIGILTGVVELGAAIAALIFLALLLGIYEVGHEIYKFASAIKRAIEKITGLKLPELATDVIEGLLILIILFIIAYAYKKVEPHLKKLKP